jgi:hypothetical protein
MNIMPTHIRNNLYFELLGLLLSNFGVLTRFDKVRRRKLLYFSSYTFYFVLTPVVVLVIVNISEESHNASFF